MIHPRGLHSPPGAADEAVSGAHSTSIDTELGPDSSKSSGGSLASLAPFLPSSSESDDQTDSGTGTNPLSSLAPFLPNSGSDSGEGSSSASSSPAATSLPTSASTVPFESPTAAPPATTSSPAAASTSAAASGSLSTGARAGIAVGVAGFCVLVLGALAFLLVRRRHQLRRAERVARQREKMDRPPSAAGAAADLPHPRFAGLTLPSGPRVVSYAPTLPPKDEEYAAAGVSIQPLDSPRDEGNESDGGWRWRRGRERADTDAGPGDEQERRGSQLRPGAAAARHARTRSTGVDLATMTGPRLDEMVRQEEEDEERRKEGYELQRVNSGERRAADTSRSSRTVVLPAVPPGRRDESARASVRSWGNWAWSGGKPSSKDTEDEGKP